VEQLFIKAAFHRSGFLSKRLFIEAAFHQSGFSSNRLFHQISRGNEMAKILDHLGFHAAKLLYWHPLLT
jgi:hypothetical protein